ncbi:MAG: hypothetical protein FWC00_02570 [Firmicutes bacterium]|nr:hypothetical protein [Bacillota bacterium]
MLNLNSRTYKIIACVCLAVILVSSSIAIPLVVMRNGDRVRAARVGAGVYTAKGINFGINGRQLDLNDPESLIPFLASTLRGPLLELLTAENASAIIGQLLGDDLGLSLGDIFDGNIDFGNLNIDANLRAALGSMLGGIDSRSVSALSRQLLNDLRGIQGVDTTIRNTLTSLISQNQGFIGNQLEGVLGMLSGTNFGIDDMLRALVAQYTSADFLSNLDLSGMFPDFDDSLFNILRDSGVLDPFMGRDLLQVVNHFLPGEFHDLNIARLIDLIGVDLESTFMNIIDVPADMTFWRYLFNLSAQTPSQQMYHLITGVLNTFFPMPDDPNDRMVLSVEFYLDTAETQSAGINIDIHNILHSLPSIMACDSISGLRGAPLFREVLTELLKILVSDYSIFYLLTHNAFPGFLDANMPDEGGVMGFFMTVGSAFGLVEPILRTGFAELINTQVFNRGRTTAMPTTLSQAQRDLWRANAHRMVDADLVIRDPLFGAIPFTRMPIFDILYEAVLDMVPDLMQAQGVNIGPNDIRNLIDIFANLYDTLTSELQQIYSFLLFRGDRTDGDVVAGVIETMIPFLIRMLDNQLIMGIVGDMLPSLLTDIVPAPINDRDFMNFTIDFVLNDLQGALAVIMNSNDLITDLFNFMQPVVNFGLSSPAILNAAAEIAIAYMPQEFASPEAIHLFAELLARVVPGLLSTGDVGAFLFDNVIPDFLMVLYQNDAVARAYILNVLLPELVLPIIPDFLHPLLNEHVLNVVYDALIEFLPQITSRHNGASLLEILPKVLANIVPAIFTPGYTDLVIATLAGNASELLQIGILRDFIVVFAHETAVGFINELGNLNPIFADLVPMIMGIASAQNIANAYDFLVMQIHNATHGQGITSFDDLVTALIIHAQTHVDAITNAATNLLIYAINNDVIYSATIAFVFEQAGNLLSNPAIAGEINAMLRDIALPLLDTFTPEVIMSLFSGDALVDAVIELFALEQLVAFAHSGLYNVINSQALEGVLLSIGSFLQTDTVTSFDQLADMLIVHVIDLIDGGLLNDIIDTAVDFAKNLVQDDQFYARAINEITSRLGVFLGHAEVREFVSKQLSNLINIDRNIVEGVLVNVAEVLSGKNITSLDQLASIVFSKIEPEQIIRFVISNLAVIMEDVQIQNLITDLVVNHVPGLIDDLFADINLDLGIAMLEGIDLNAIIGDVSVALGTILSDRDLVANLVSKLGPELHVLSEMATLNEMAEHLFDFAINFVLSNEKILDTIIEAVIPHLHTIIASDAFYTILESLFDMVGDVGEMLSGVVDMLSVLNITVVENRFIIGGLDVLLEQAGVEGLGPLLNLMLHRVEFTATEYGDLLNLDILFNTGSGLVELFPLLLNDISALLGPDISAVMNSDVINISVVFCTITEVIDLVVDITIGTLGPFANLFGLDLPFDINLDMTVSVGVSFGMA